MKLPKFCLIALTSALTVVSALAADGWQTDYDAALAKAKSENKYVLINFTGSDWCGWCIRLRDETFSKKEFQKFADKNLILVELDFPDKKPQSNELKAQNQKLQQEYHIEGYPTLVLLNSEGKEVARDNYIPGGPKALEKWVNDAK